MAGSKPQPSPDPGAVLRPGRFDAQTVLLLWCLRKSFFPILFAGFTIAIVVFQDVETLEAKLETFNDPQSIVAGVVSPLAGVVIAIGVRVLAGLRALAAAYPLTRWTRATDYAQATKLGPFVVGPPLHGPRLPIDALDIGGSPRRRRASRAVEPPLRGL